MESKSHGGSKPRRHGPLRGSDFLMRWSQGVWSERRIAEAINATGRYWAIAYGPSGVAPDQQDLSDEYFDRLKRAEALGMKRPDLLVVRWADLPRAEALVNGLGGPAELQFRHETELRPLLDLAVVGLECENSLWRAERMPAYGKPLKLQRRTGKLGLAKSAVLPTVILKEQDRGPLLAWEAANGIPIHIWQVFFDRAWGISLQEACRLIDEGAIAPTEQVFHAPSGATTRKVIYKVWYQLAYSVGGSGSEPALMAHFIEEKNGKILPYVRFEGGSLHLSSEGIAALDRAAEQRP